MPELPEVETIARKLRPNLVGKTILEANLLWARTLGTPTPGQFKRRIKGQGIRLVGRRAKYLHLQLSYDHLFFHLKMSGDVYLRDRALAPEKHDRLILSLSGDKVLTFNDTRKFGRVWLVSDPEQVTAGLGPEPLQNDFTAEKLFAGLQGRRRQLKPLLMDQTFIAGLGNIYTDEALHQAHLHPLMPSHTISRKQAQDLWTSIRAVLQEGIRRNGASIDWVYQGGEFQNYFRVYARKGQPCRECGTAIERIVVGQRGTHFCPNCQSME